MDETSVAGELKPSDIEVTYSQGGFHGSRDTTVDPRKIVNSLLEFDYGTPTVCRCYNEADGVTLITLSGADSGTSSSVFGFYVKGKVSQSDAQAIIDGLQKTDLLKVSPVHGSIIETPQIEEISKYIADYFNNRPKI